MMLTYRDPKARPSAKDALQDPWLKGNSTERNQGKPIDATVVQRIQVSTQGPCPLCKIWFAFFVSPSCLSYQSLDESTYDEHMHTLKIYLSQHCCPLLCLSVLLTQNASHDCMRLCLCSPDFMALL